VTGRGREEMGKRSPGVGCEGRSQGDDGAARTELCNFDTEVVVGGVGVVIVREHPPTTSS
jgi:hypothetical protein